MHRTKYKIICKVLNFTSFAIIKLVFFKIKKNRTHLIKEKVSLHTEVLIFFIIVFICKFSRYANLKSNHLKILKVFRSYYYTSFISNNFS